MCYYAPFFNTLDKNNTLIKFSEQAIDSLYYLMLTFSISGFKGLELCSVNQYIVEENRNKTIANNTSVISCQFMAF